jgi:tRNA1(Val) A37 N6-methylase TrmN6
VQDSAFCWGIKIAEKHSLIVTKCVHRCGSDQVLLLSECQLSRESDAKSKFAAVDII